MAGALGSAQSVLGWPLIPTLLASAVGSSRPNRGAAQHDISAEGPLDHLLGRVTVDDVHHLLRVAPRASLGYHPSLPWPLWAGVESRPTKRREMGTIEHTLLDEGRSSSPTDLRPSPATPPYHKKRQTLLYAAKGRKPVESRPGLGS